jgi:hypothetical protein
MTFEAMGILNFLGQMNTGRHDLIEHWTDTAQRSSGSRRPAHSNALNQKPRHHPQFTKLWEDRDSVHNIQMSRQKQPRKAYGHQSKAVNDQPCAEYPRKEARSHHQNTEGEKPKSPKDVGDIGSICVQTEEQHSQRVTLGIVEYGQKIGAVDQGQSSDRIQHIQEGDGDRHQPQGHHQGTHGSCSLRAVTGTEP